MEKNIFRKKTAALIIFFFFIVASFIPSVSGSTAELEDKQSVKSQKNVEDQKGVLVTCYNFGLSEQSSKEIKVPYCEVEELFTKISDYSIEIARDPQSQETQQLYQEIIRLAGEQNLLHTYMSNESPQIGFNSFFNSRAAEITQSPILQNKASAFFCNFATTGTGSQFPIIIFPRLIPIIQLPIPRAFLRWTATEGITSCGGLLSGKGFIAYGQQKGLALGFWGIGFSVFLPPIMQYGFIGYALYARVDAEVIELWPPNSLPAISQISPGDGETNVPLSLSDLQFHISDFDGDLMSYMVTTTPDIGSGSGNLKKDGVYSIPISGLEGLTEYSWHIEVSDGMDTTIDDFTFITEAIAPIVSNPSPHDDERYVPADLSHLSFHLKDFQGDPMDYTVETIPNIGSDSGSGVGEGTYTVPVSGLDYSLECTWYVNATDGEHQTNKIFHFQIEHKMTFDPFTEGWQYRKEITIDHTRVDGDLLNFPVLISITDVDLRDKAQDDGDDILFMDGAGIANRCYHEIESYDYSSGEIVVWVSVESLSSIEDTIIFMYYGNTICYNQHAPELVLDSSYMGVWHFIGPSGKLYDSTFHNNDGAIYGATWTTGISGYALDFDEQGDYVDVGDVSSLSITGDISISTWIKTDEVQCGVIVNKFDIANPDNGYCLTMGKLYIPDDTLSFYIAKDSSVFDVDYDYFTTSEGFADGFWHYVVATYTPDGSSRPHIWVDGEEAEGSASGSPQSSIGASPGYPFRIAAYSQPDTPSVPFDGTIDEVRISNINRNAEWISTEYNNQNDPSSFMDIGPEVSPP